MKQNFSVKAILRNDKKRKDGTYPINYRVTIDSRVLKLSSGEYVEETKWNKIDACFKGSKSSIENSSLEYDIARIKDFIRIQRSVGKFLTLDSVKNFYSTKPADDFFKFYDEFCVRKFLEISIGTSKHYTLLRKRLKQFKNDIRFSQIDLKFIEDFDTFLKKTSVISVAGIFNRHKNMKAVLRQALKQKLIQENPYEDFKFKRGEPKFGHLTNGEINAIKNMAFDDEKNAAGLQITKDMFLFSCFTGLRFSDVHRLTWHNVIDMKYLSLVTKKTKTKVNIPLSKSALQIMKKYNANGSSEVFIYRTNQCLNRDLKRIAEIGEIKKTITFHMARHTFATILVNNNVNPFHIRLIMAHSSMNQTMAYVNTSIDVLNDAISKVGVFN